MKRQQAEVARPARQRAQQVTLGVLLLIALWVGVVQFGGGQQGTGRPAEAGAMVAGLAVQAQGAAAVQEGAGAWAGRAPVAVTWPVEVGRDPFVWERLRPVEVAAAVAQAGPDAGQIERQARQRLRLQGVMYEQASRRALINGRMFEPGSQVEGYEVMEIHERAVTVRREGVTVRLSM